MPCCTYLMERLLQILFRLGAGLLKSPLLLCLEVGTGLCHKLRVLTPELRFKGNQISLSLELRALAHDFRRCLLDTDRRLTLHALHLNPLGARRDLGLGPLCLERKVLANRRLTGTRGAQIELNLGAAHGRGRKHCTSVLKGERTH